MNFQLNRKSGHAANSLKNCIKERPALTREEQISATMRWIKAAEAGDAPEREVPTALLPVEGGAEAKLHACEDHLLERGASARDW